MSPQQRLVTRAAEAARAVDRGEQPAWDSLAAAGPEGLLDLGRGTREDPGDLTGMVDLLTGLGSVCLSTAFALWGHRMSLEYLDATGRELPEGALEGRAPLSSAMAPLFKAAAGLGEVPVVATPDADGGVVLDGMLPWASNLLPGARLVLPARTEDGGVVVVLVPGDAEGVTVHQLRGLTALEATASGAVRLEGVRVPAVDVLTTDGEGFRQRVTAPFLLLQSSFCLGLAVAALEASAERVNGPEGATFGDDLERLTARRDELAATLRERAADPAQGEVIDLVELRLRLAHLAKDATSLERAVSGGRGFAAGSDTSRRVREAEFLPVQSPTEGHLRTLLAAAGRRAA